MPRVVVIDDGFAPVTFKKLPEAVQRVLLAENSLEAKAAVEFLEALLKTESKLPYFSALKQHADDGDILEFLQTDDFAHHILLPNKEKILQPGLLAEYNGSDLASELDEIDRLRGAFETAFGATNIVYLSDRRGAINEIVKFDLLVLDLFVENHVDVIGDLTAYLTLLVAEMPAGPIPPILLMSSHEELKPNLGRLRFGSKISAAGMVAMKKGEILATQFGASGIELLWQQLHHQREAATAARLLAVAWEQALKDALEEAAKTIWSLDASAMQQFHYTALIENDPFDEHLSDLLIREHLWHVEKNSDFQTALADLDRALLKEVKIDAASDGYELTSRFSQHLPHEEVMAVSKIQSHYHWSGSRLSTEPVALTAEEFHNQFNRLIPFGAVLCGPVRAEGADVLLHVTQQCDLNKRNIFNSRSSVLFLIGSLMSSSHPRAKKENEIVLPGMKLDTARFDVSIVPTRYYAIPVEYLRSVIAERQLTVVARARLDIARQCLQAMLNHASRPAAFSIQEKSPEKVKLFFHVMSSDEFLPYPIHGNPKVAKAVEGIRVFPSNRLIFSDEESNHIALWLNSRSPSAVPGDLAVSRIASQLRLGIPSSGSLAHISYASYIAKNFARCLSETKGLDVRPDETKLVIFREENA